MKYKVHHISTYLGDLDKLIDHYFSHEMDENYELQDIKFSVEPFNAHLERSRDCALIIMKLKKVK